MRQFSRRNFIDHNPSNSKMKRAKISQNAEKRHMWLCGNAFHENAQTSTCSSALSQQWLATLMAGAHCAIRLTFARYLPVFRHVTMPLIKCFYSTCNRLFLVLLLSPMWGLDSSKANWRIFFWICCILGPPCKSSMCL